MAGEEGVKVSAPAADHDVVDDGIRIDGNGVDPRDEAAVAFCVAPGMVDGCGDDETAGARLDDDGVFEFVIGGVDGVRTLRVNGNKKKNKENGKKEKEVSCWGSTLAALARDGAEDEADEEAGKRLAQRCLSHRRKVSALGGERVVAATAAVD